MVVSGNPGRIPPRAGENTLPSRGVTIIVPATASGRDVQAAIASVLEHGELGELRDNELLVIDDGGDQLDAGLRAAIDARPFARYEANPEELGAIASINRAVLELAGSERDVLVLQDGAVLTAGALQAMTAALRAGERHGVVVPRSNQGAAARMPATSRLAQPPATPEHAHDVFSVVHDLLPAWTVTPTGDDVCFLVRRDLVKNHGFLDPAFSTVRGATVDLTVRMAQLGHSTLIANHAFVEWRGQDAESLADEDDDNVRLAERYPFLSSVVGDFLSFEIDAVDHFAELFLDSGARRSVLIDLHELTLHYDGTARNAIAFLHALRERAPALDVDFAVHAPADVAAFFGIERFGFPVVAADDPHVYDVALSLSPLTQTAAILAINRKAVRWVILHLDIIALRSLELRSASWARKRVVRDSLRYADRIVSISSASVEDIRDFYPELQTDERRLTVLPQGATTARFSARSGDIDFHDLPTSTRRAIETKSFILVMGNGYPHKQVARTLETLGEGGHTVISIGGHVDRPRAGRTLHSLPPGRLSDALLRRLLSSARVLVYPSAYEGFGLPIVEAVAARKRVVAFRSNAVSETVEALGLQEFVDLFDDFAGLPALLESALRRPAPTAGDVAGLRTADEFNDELIDIVLDTVKVEIDADALRRRWDHFVTLNEYRRDIAVAYEQLDRTHQDSRAYIQLVQARRSYRLTERVLVTLDPVRRLARRAASRIKPPAPGS
jgi:glycosyltransferase involved in cell wall biosynthesis/GT2 family glycosyltransferase